MSSQKSLHKERDKVPAAAAPKRVRTPGTDLAWATEFEARYISKSQSATRARAHRKVRKPWLVAAGPDAKLFAEIRREKALDLRARVKLRLEQGFRHHGGPIGPDSDYRRDAFVLKGLVSDRHPILQCFVSKLHRKKRLKVGDAKHQALSPDSKLLGCDALYVEANKICCGIVRQEIDAVVSRADVVAGCAAAGVSEPNLIVGWQDKQGRYHHPHLLWLLFESVPLKPRRGEQNVQGRAHPTRFAGLYRGVMRGLAAALLPLGADVGGLSNAHRHKNPLSPLWDCEILAEQPYSLAELAGQVDTTVRMVELERRASELRRDALPTVDHPDPEIAAGSNHLFRHLTKWARAEVVRVRAGGGSEAEFGTLVAAEACRSTADHAGDNHRSEKVALVTAQRVSWWTWNIWRAPQPKQALTAEQVVERRQEGGRLAAGLRRDRSLQILVGAAFQLREQGVKVTQAAVLELAKAEGLRAEKTVRNHWDAVLEALADANR
jgi:hypothetical protein